MWTQTNRTLGLSGMGDLSVERSGRGSRQAAVRRAGCARGRRCRRGSARTSPRRGPAGSRDLPVLVALARVDGAGVAAAHGDDDVGGADDVVGERLGERGGDVDPEFGHGGDARRRSMAAAGLGAGGADVHPALAAQCWSRAGGHLGAAGVVHADEQHLGHLAGRPRPSTGRGRSAARWRTGRSRAGRCAVTRAVRARAV